MITRIHIHIHGLARLDRRNAEAYLSRDLKMYLSLWVNRSQHRAVLRAVPAFADATYALR